MKIELPVVDYDERWKQIIGQMAFPFVQYVLPNLHKKLDKTKPIISLDKEFGTIFPDYGKKGKIYPDKLLLARLKDGKATRIFVHVEIQGNAGDDFTKRVFDYLHPIRNKYPKTDFTVVVIYIGNQIPTNPSIYIYKYHGTEISYKFNTIIVKDLEEEELLASQNPFALVLLASLYSLKTNQGTKSAIKQRLFFKKKLARLCFEKGYLKEFIVDLLNFVAFAISLPRFEDDDFKQELSNLLTHNKMNIAEQHPEYTDIWFLALFGMEYKPYMQQLHRGVEKEVLEKHEILKKEVLRQAELAKKEVENIKKEAQKAESAKQKAESAKQKAESAKQKAESAKQKAESAKQKAESAKQKAESAKQKAESAKQKAESAKQKAENDKIKILKISINSLLKFGMSEKDIAKELNITLKSVKEILKEKK